MGMLSGKVGLVTGSTSGIGLGIAKALAGQGAAMALNGFGEPPVITGVVSSVQGLGVRAAHYDADVSDPRQIARMVAQVEKDFGRLDILVNNAGIQHVSPLDSFPVDKWDDVIAVNLSAAFHGIRAALPGMRARNWGRIINVASVHGLVASANKVAYVAAKHGLVGLTKGVALETAQTAITCNAICPGWVLTPLVQQQVDARARQDHVPGAEGKRRLLLEKQPSGEFVTPEQVGGLAVFLCSPAADQVRGAAWNIDGGWVAQ